MLALPFAGTSNTLYSRYFVNDFFKLTSAHTHRYPVVSQLLIVCAVTMARVFSELLLCAALGSFSGHFVSANLLQPPSTNHSSLLTSSVGTVLPRSSYMAVMTLSLSILVVLLWLRPSGIHHPSTCGACSLMPRDCLRRNFCYNHCCLLSFLSAVFHLSALSWFLEHYPFLCSHRVVEIF